MTVARLEMLVEPFRENAPGPHVIAAVEAGRAAGVTVEMGPLATVVEAGVDQLVDAAAAMLRAAFANGATAAQLHIERAVP